jgi:hypothetical protein
VQLLVFEASDDLSDILVKLNVSQPPADYFSQMITNSHCSVLVKPSEDGMHLFASHVTWTTFANMVRIYKHYNLPFSLASTKADRVSFSSTPASIVSGDDFYITDNQLVIMETTNSVMNMTLYDYVTEKTVLYWIRNTVANRMASTGAEWAKWFAMYNSGTYNNQWIVVDYKLFTPGQPLLPGTLWIAEQIPGYVIGADETSVLSQSGYWASYNIPFFPFVYNISGYPAFAKKFPWGNLYSYSDCPRAKIFRRDQDAVSTLNDMKKIMRYNQWQTDPLSLGNSCLSISARCDLNPPANSPGAFGAIDGKVTDERMSKVLESKAVCGPTWDSQPVFAWTSEWQQTAHYGQPQVFDYEWETMKPLIA